jgi:RNA-splicing ligase RtcB
MVGLMLTYEGQYTTANVMIDAIDQETVKQIYQFINHEAFKNYVAIMPDCHAGAGAVIGFTMPMTDLIIPNVIGVDINCGMLMYILNKNPFEKNSPENIDKIIRQTVPFGPRVREEQNIIDFSHDLWWKEISLDNLNSITKLNKKFGTSYPITKYNVEWFEEKCNQIEIPIDRAINSLGTLGGGNHFIEFGKSINNDKWSITIHTGSRQFGLKVAKYWQKKAGKGELAYLQGDDMFGYLTDMIFAQHYARLNRQTIGYDIILNLNIEISDIEEIIETNHNFIDFDDFIIRKGAIRSYENEKMIIPFNMEDGIILCEGKSNLEWNYSAPHGAGRLGSRRWAKENLNIEEAKSSMQNKGIYCSKLPLDEARGAYKNPSLIEEAIGPTATIIDRFVPVLSMKE